MKMRSMISSLGAAILCLVGGSAAAEDPHSAVFDTSNYPSASMCAPCHRNIYDEWRTSAHAYASISPVFHKFEQAISDLSRGTIGSFCVRCHASAGTSMREPREMPLWQRAPVSREGITCVTCHRVAEDYYRENGERRIEPGDIHAPVYGVEGGVALGEALGRRAELGLAIAPGEKGRPVHTGVVRFETLRTSEACAPCHQVAVAGIKLEVVWEQYQASPAAAQGVTCQDCHMSKEQGTNAGYATGPGATIRGNVLNPNRRHANHAFAGPGYSISHPGIFPHSDEANSFAVEDWLTFDPLSEWGTPQFEAALEAGGAAPAFPAAWKETARRKEARRIVDANRALLAKRDNLRRQVMEHSLRIDGPFFDDPIRVGESFDFDIRLKNENPGHNLPSGSLGAQPELWLNIALVGPDGKRVWETGYVDPQGDMADLHSAAVLSGEIPADDQLVNLQTKFLTTTVKGTDREMYLPINFDLDQVPIIRPAAVPTSVLNHPPFVRMEGRSLPPLGERIESFTIPAEAISRAGRYRMHVRVRTRAEPIYFMRFIGATDEMVRRMNAGMIDIRPYAVDLEVK